MEQSALSNRGRRVGLLRGSGTRMALWFYAMIRGLRLEHPLRDTIHAAKFRSLVLKKTAVHAVEDIENKLFFKAMYFLCRSVFSGLKLLRHCDANRPAMDMIVFLTHRTTIALERSVEVLNDLAIFGEFGGEDEDLSMKANEVFGDNER